MSAFDTEQLIPFTVQLIERDIGEAVKIIESLPSGVAAEIIAALPEGVVTQIFNRLQVSYSAAIL